MILIAYDNGNFFGGYGDRVVGLIACKAMADLLGQEFKILWTKEDVTPYIDYGKYALRGEAPKPVTTYGSVDRQKEYKHMLMHAPAPFNPTGTAKFHLNQEIAQYLYKNPRFADRCYTTEMFALYKTLYTDILKPTAASLQRADQICGAHTNIIGIQIRTGDLYIPNNRNINTYVAIRDVDTTLQQMFGAIKAHIETATQTTPYTVFVTSDHPSAHAIATRVWPVEQVLSNPDPAQHIDRPVSGEFSNFFVDNYILSQRTTRLYISDYSNYGRIAALSATHDNLFDIRGQPLEKLALLSKHEQLFTA